MEKSTYRFVGHTTEFMLGGLKFERFGDKAEFSTEEAMDVVLGGGNFIPEAEFATLGFTPDELRKYAYAGPRATCTPEFRKKWTKATAIFTEAHEVLRAQRAALEAPPEPVVEKPIEEPAAPPAPIADRAPEPHLIEEERE